MHAALSATRAALRRITAATGPGLEGAQGKEGANLPDEMKLPGRGGPPDNQ